MLIVDRVHRITTSGQCDSKFTIYLLIIRVATPVKLSHIGCSCTIDTHTIKQGNKIIIALAVNFTQLYRNQIYLFKSTCIEQEKVPVVPPQDIPRVMSDHRLQLEDVTHKQQLFASKGFAHIA